MGYEETLSLLHSFYSLDFILRVPANKLTSLLIKAKEKEIEQASWELWSNSYPFMACGFLPFKSFKDFKKEVIKPQRKCSQKSYKEIEKEMLKVVDAYEKGGS